VAHKITVFPEGNADSLLVDLDDGRKLLFDFANKRDPEDDSDLRVDLAAELSERLAAARSSGFDVVAFSHLEAQVFKVPCCYTAVHQIDVGPDPASHALGEIELGEPQEAGRIITVGVFGRLPTASCFQNHTGGVQEMVGSLIIPSLLHCTSSSHIGPIKSFGRSAASLMIMRLRKRLWVLG
jgi:hypothetical protein